MGRARALIALSTLSAFVHAGLACSSSDDPVGAAEAGAEAGPLDAAEAQAEASAADADPDSGPAPTPPTAEVITGLTLFDGWTDPRALAAPVDTEGWEQTSFISPSGRRLYFSYTRFDYSSAINGALAYVGPIRPGSSRSAFEIYEAEIGPSGWNVAQSAANYPGFNGEAAEGVDDAESTMVLIRYDNTGPIQGDVYITHKTSGEWGPSSKLPAPINSPCMEDHAALSADGQRLYFESTRADPLGTTCKTQDGGAVLDGPPHRDIYVSTLLGGIWSTPIAVTGEPAMGYGHWKVYSRRDATELYWSGSDAVCGPGISCVYRATRQPDGSYGGRVVVMKATSEALAQPGDAFDVGSVSITQDGRFMYFTYIVRSSLDGGFDGGPGVNVNIGVARRP